MKNVLALHLELCFAVSIILAVVWSPGPTTIHRPWPNHMVSFFLPYLNVLLWIMLSAPGCFFDSQIKIPVMYQTNVYVTPAGFLSCNLSWKVCVWPFAAWKHSLNGIPGSPWYPLLCLNGNR